LLDNIWQSSTAFLKRFTFGHGLDKPLGRFSWIVQNPFLPEDPGTQDGQHSSGQAHSATPSLSLVVGLDKKVGGEGLQTMIEERGLNPYGL
jgi:hypothetical protein